MNPTPLNTAFKPGMPWLDTQGHPIQAHGGGILYEEGTYYWFGENKDTPNCPGTTRVDVVGINCYSSRDLLNWTYEGLVLPAQPDNPGHDLHPSQVLERPKVVHNAATGKYVMWMHVDAPGYQKASTGVAISDRVTGPYTYLGSFQPNGKESRDMTVFKDSDEKAYLVHSSDWNSVTLIADLSADYLRPTGHYSRQFDHHQKNTGRESPALFNHEGRYFIITSGTTGWSPNPAEYAVSDSPHGPWTIKGNPCVGLHAETTFCSQSTFVLPVAGKRGAFIFMADRWDRHNLRDSRYVWLPLRIRNDRLILEWHDAWDLSIFNEPSTAPS